MQVEVVSSNVLCTCSPNRNVYAVLNNVLFNKIINYKTMTFGNMFVRLDCKLLFQWYVQLSKL